jgi:hypothetical protein
MASRSAAEQQTSPDNMQSASEYDAAENSMSPAVSRPSDEPGAILTLPESIAVNVDIPDVTTVASQLDYPHSMSLDSDWNAGLTIDAAHAVPYDAVQDLENVPDANLPLAPPLINWDMESSWEDQTSSAPNVPPIPIINRLPAQASTSALQTSVEDHNQPHHDPSFTNSVDFRALELSAEMTSRSEQQLSNIPEEPHHDTQSFPPATALPPNVADEQLLTDQRGSQEFRHVTHYHHYHHHYHHHHHHYHHYSPH